MVVIPSTSTTCGYDKKKKKNAVVQPIMPLREKDAGIGQPEWRSQKY